MKKTIQINPELFKVNGDKRKKSRKNRTMKKTDKKKKTMEKKTNTLKKALIRRIQAHQERHRQKIEREQLKMKKENERLRAKLASKEKEKAKSSASSSSASSSSSAPNPSSYDYLKKLQERVNQRKQVRKEKRSRSRSRSNRSTSRSSGSSSASSVSKPSPSVSKSVPSSVPSGSSGTSSGSSSSSSSSSQLQSFLQHVDTRNPVVAKKASMISLGRHTGNIPSATRETFENAQPQNPPKRQEPSHHTQPQNSQPSSRSMQSSMSSRSSSSSLSSLSTISPVPEPTTPVVLKEPPPYGILKGGSKPLYSSYRKTRKQQERLQTLDQRQKNHTLSNHEQQPVSIQSSVSLPKNTVEPLPERRANLERVRAMFQQSKQQRELITHKNDKNDKNDSTEDTDTMDPLSSDKNTSRKSFRPFEEKTKDMEHMKDMKDMKHTTHTNDPFDTMDNKENILNKDSYRLPVFRRTFSNRHPLASGPSRGGRHRPGARTRKRIRRITRRRYKVGKVDTPRGKKIHLLIKNRKTRKNQTMEQKEWKSVPILEVRKYLRERNLIRVGSQAPETILRQIYEATRLSGDIENKSSEFLLHNYMNTDGKTDGDLAPIPQTEMGYDVDKLLRELDGHTNQAEYGDTSSIDAMLLKS